MGFHCNQEVTKKMPKKKVSLAHNSLMADLDLTYARHNKKGGMPWHASKRCFWFLKH